MDYLIAALLGVICGAVLSRIGVGYRYVGKRLDDLAGRGVGKSPGRKKT